MSKLNPDLHEPCIAMDTMPSLERPDIDIVAVPMIKATAESFREYGRLVYDPDSEEIIIETWPAQGWRSVEPGTGNEGGTTEGLFEFERCGDLMLARNHAVDGSYVTGWFSDPAVANANEKSTNTDHVFVREANYHPDGGQMFYPVNGQPFFALLALPGDDITPDDFVAFYCDGSFGIQIFPNIWHQPLFPVDESATFFDKQSRVHACIAVDFVNEFGVYLKVPLKPE